MEKLKESQKLLDSKDSEYKNLHNFYKEQSEQHLKNIRDLQMSHEEKVKTLEGHIHNLKNGYDENLRYTQEIEKLKPKKQKLRKIISISTEVQTEGSE